MTPCRLMSGLPKGAETAMPGWENNPFIDDKNKTQKGSILNVSKDQEVRYIQQKLSNGGMNWKLRRSVLSLLSEDTITQLLSSVSTGVKTRCGFDKTYVMTEFDSYIGRTIYRIIRNSRHGRNNIGSRHGRMNRRGGKNDGSRHGISDSRDVNWGETFGR
ncbi:hypothetical protein BC829DRAFT_421179 [Chytridium lagenaria]|nr:hypothetical protein BC829DRAFT_421179 [Chytridium lagenaria]